MAPMASRRTQSASVIAASSSLSSSDTICRLKILNSASSIFSWVARSSASCFELAIKFFLSWISCSVARTLSLRSSSSLSKRSSLWELADVLVLASRASFLSLTSHDFSAISTFKETCEQRASILRRAFSTLAQKKGRCPAGQSSICTTSGSRGWISSKRCFISSESWTKVSIGAESRSFICRSWFTTPVGCNC
jgi:hypothetical protein